MSAATPASTPVNSTGSLPYLEANSLSSDTHHYVSFVPRVVNARNYPPNAHPGELDYRDFDTGFFINAYGAKGFFTSPGINAGEPSYCASVITDPYCRLAVDSIVCPYPGGGAQVYGHYLVNSTNYYFLITVKAGTNGTGTFSIGSQSPAESYFGPTIHVNSVIQCS